MMRGTFLCRFPNARRAKFGKMGSSFYIAKREYNEQISKLPPKIQVADEIALMFNDEVIAVADDLSKKGMLSEQECYLISSIGNKLKEMSATHNDKLWTLNALQNSADWKDCRSKARILLLSLEYVDWIIN